MRGSLLRSSLLLFLAAGAAGAQQLLTVVDGPDADGAVGVARSPPTSQSRQGSADSGLPAIDDGPAEPAELAVLPDFALLRSGPEQLSLLTPDGAVYHAERTGFEDRGEGNALWTGRVPGEDHSTVVLTLHDGHLIGTFGRPGEAGLAVRVPPAGPGRVIRDHEEPFHCEVEHPDPLEFPGLASVLALPPPPPI